MYGAGNQRLLSLRVGYRCERLIRVEKGWLQDPKAATQLDRLIRVGQVGRPLPVVRDSYSKVGVPYPTYSPSNEGTLG